MFYLVGVVKMGSPGLLFLATPAMYVATTQINGDLFIFLEDAR
jgi:hypothetical protein